MTSHRMETAQSISGEAISVEILVGATAIFAAAVAGVMPILAHAVHPVIGIACGILLAFSYSRLSPPLAVLTLLFSFIFQNLIISLFIAWIPTKGDLDFVRGYNFLSVAVVWLSLVCSGLCRVSIREWSRDEFICNSIVTLGIIGIYFVIGLPLYGTNAIIYLRNIATPVLCFQIVYITFSFWKVRSNTAMILLGQLIIACGFAEFFFRDLWLSYTSSGTYWEVLSGPNWHTLAYDKTAAQTGVVASSLKDTFEITFFNSPLFDEFGTVMRMFGPNMHAISFAYCLAFFAIFTLFRGYLIQALFFAVLMFLCSAKGPVILLILILLSWSVARLLGNKLAFAFHIILLTLYALVGVITGLEIGDFHVLGLMAGLQDFFGNPFGYGLGAGGVYDPRFAAFDWHAAQAEGRTPFPVESSIGVLLYQMGLASLALVAFYGWLSWRIMQLARLTQNALHIATYLALLSMIANGLFQEEAFFSPLTLVLYVALAGAILGAAKRRHLLQSPASIQSIAGSGVVGSYTGLQK
jgi:hypothetical protein